jgi:SAM-dependent methyltransferase
VSAPSTLSYCKLCELEDFRDPDLRALMRDMATEPHGPDYPDGEEHRKSWEVAMTARSLRDFGALGEDSEILGVGAGREATIFWLTRHVKRVFATDLYLNEDSWSGTDSGVQMLVSPEKQTRMDWNPKRLVVQHMDGRKLRYESDSFDGIFSSGSIEHFGTLDEIRESVEEIYRVLRPGGVAALATEFRLDGPPGSPGTVLFDEGELRSVLLDGMAWEPASPLDLSISEETLAQPIDFGELVLRELPKPPETFAEKVRDKLGIYRPPEREEEDVPKAHLDTEYPHIVLNLHHPELLRPMSGDEEPRTWTSVHLALVKPRG